MVTTAALRMPIRKKNSIGRAYDHMARYVSDVKSVRNSRERRNA